LSIPRFSFLDENADVKEVTMNKQAGFFKGPKIEPNPIALAMTRAQLKSGWLRAWQAEQFPLFQERLAPWDIGGRACEAVPTGTSFTLTEYEWLPELNEVVARAFARLILDPQTNRWRLYWADRHDRWLGYHEYGEDTVYTLAEALDEIQADPDGCFFG
jgi:hypothetical protein